MPVKKPGPDADLRSAAGTGLAAFRHARGG